MPDTPATRQARRREKLRASGLTQVLVTIPNTTAALREVGVSEGMGVRVNDYLGCRRDNPLGFTMASAMLRALADEVEAETKEGPGA